MFVFFAGGGGNGLLVSFCLLKVNLLIFCVGDNLEIDFCESGAGFFGEKFREVFVFRGFLDFLFFVCG